MHEDFLQAVLAHPDEEAPRLIYADWLEEQGDTDRAEFIRIQIELEHLPYGHPRHVGLVRRKIELERACEASWQRQLLPDALQPRPVSEFRRGFVEYLQIDVKSFLLHAETLIERTPLRHVSFTGVGGKAKALSACAALEGLRQLDILIEPLGTKDVAALGRSPHLHGLASLKLRGNLIGPYHLAALTASTAMTGLRALDLSFNRLEAEGAAMLAAWPLARRLEELRLYDCHLGDEGVAALAASPLLTRLRVLDLGANQLTSDAVTVLAAAKHWAALEELKLDNNATANLGA